MQHALIERHIFSFMFKNVEYDFNAKGRKIFLFSLKNFGTQRMF